MSTKNEWASVRAELLADDPETSARLNGPAHRFAVAMVAARTNRGWTQRDLAERVGVSQPLIARLEAGDRDPRLSTLVAISRALDLPLNVLKQNLAAS